MAGPGTTQVTIKNTPSDADSAKKSDAPEPRRVGRTGAVVILVVLITLAVLLLDTLVQIWPPQSFLGTITTTNSTAAATPAPSVATATAAPGASGAPASVTPAGAESSGPSTTTAAAVADPTRQAPFLFWQVALTQDQSLFVVVIVAGALGAMAHVLRSFMNYLGTRELVWSWVPSYFLLPVIGSVLATIMYVVVRAGLVTGPIGASTNVFGFVAIATLVGLFSGQAAEKLKEIFEVILKPPPKQSEPLPEPKSDGATADGGTAAVTLTIDPAAAAAGEKITIKGAPMDGVTKVTFAGGVASSDVSWDSGTQSLSVTVPPGAQTGTITVELDGKPVTTTELTVNPEVPKPEQNGGGGNGGGGNGDGNGAVALTVEPNAAAVGDTVEIRGAVMDSVTTASFAGDVSADATWDAATQLLSVTVPVGAATGPITVKLNDAPVTTNDLTVTEPTPAPDDGNGEEEDGAVALTVDPDSAAVNSVVEIRGAAMDGVTTATFAGDVPAAATWDAGTQLLSVTVPQGAVTGPITVELNGAAVTTNELTVTAG